MKMIFKKDIFCFAVKTCPGTVYAPVIYLFSRTILNDCPGLHITSCAVFIRLSFTSGWIFVDCARGKICVIVPEVQSSGVAADSYWFLLTALHLEVLPHRAEDRAGHGIHRRGPDWKLPGPRAGKDAGGCQHPSGKNSKFTHIYALTAAVKVISINLQDGVVLWLNEIMSANISFWGDKSGATNRSKFNNHFS